MSADFILVLRVGGGHVAAKRHWHHGGKWQTEDYSAGFEFDVRCLEIGSIAALSSALAALESDPRSFVIRGRLANGACAASSVRRRYHGKDAAFALADHCWLAIDVDSAPAPSWLDAACLESRERAVTWAIEQYLPPVFRNVTVHYRWSSSAGVKPWTQLRLQLWFWLDRPACDRSLRAWLLPYQFADKALYNPVQPHYTAAPIFDGVSDPLAGRRSGLIVGDRDTVALPACVVDLATWSEHERRSRAAEAAQRRERLIALRSGRVASADQDRRDTFSRRMLSRAVDRIAGTGEGNNRHAAVHGQAFHIGTLVGAGLLAYSTAEAELECAAFAALPESRHTEARRTIRDGLSSGQARPFDTTKLAESANPLGSFKGRRRARIAAYLRGAR